MPDQVTNTAAQLVNLSLHRLRFKDDRPAGGQAEEVHTEFLLNARLFDDGSVGAEFGVNCYSTDRELRLRVVYRMEFTRGPGVPESLPADEFARQVSARIAPTVAFPFIREMVVSLTGKSGGPPITLPVINVGALFKPEQLRIGTPAEDSGPRDSVARDEAESRTRRKPSE